MSIIGITSLIAVVSVLVIISGRFIFKNENPRLWFLMYIIVSLSFGALMIENIMIGSFILAALQCVIVGLYAASAYRYGQILFGK